MEALVTVPNDYLEQIPAPDAQDLRALEELSPTGAAVSKKCVSAGIQHWLSAICLCLRHSLRTGFTSHSLLWPYW